jgi:hypothetical protein
MPELTPFKTTHEALETAFETMALASAINVPAYKMHMARTTATERIDWTDRITNAAWIMQTLNKTLDETECAVIVARYHRDAGTVRRFENQRWNASTPADQEGERARALKTITHKHADLHPNQPLLAAVIDREFVFGEAYMPTTRQVAQEFGVTQSVVARLSVKVGKLIREIEARTHERLQEKLASSGFLPSEYTTLEV